MGEFFVWGTLIGAIIILFPIFVCIDTHLDVRANKVWFSVRLFYFLKLVGGYMQLTSEGIAIHLSKKKGIILPYSQLLDTRKKFDITSGFQLIRLHSSLETNGANEAYGILIASAFQTASYIVFSFLTAQHPFISLENNILLSRQNNLTVSMHMVTCFNLLILLIAVCKKILEGIINGTKKKNRQHYGKNSRTAHEPD